MNEDRKIPHKSENSHIPFIGADNAEIISVLFINSKDREIIFFSSSLASILKTLKPPYMQQRRLSVNEWTEYE